MTILHAIRIAQASRRRQHRMHIQHEPPAYRATWEQYERRKRAWLESNPGATPAQIEAAMGEICRELGL